ncbi:splicing factor 3B subunit 1-like [Asparagus officinalis]|nr:splicing factor 3B subunit 1-like [Asparagus officinalis]
MTDLINPDIFTCNEQHNSRAVQVLTAVASSVGTAALVPFLESVCSIMNPGSARDAGYRTVRQIVMVNKDSVVPHMTPLVNIALKEIAAGSNTWSVASAARAIDSLARAAHSYGVNDNFSKAMPVIFHCMRNHFNRRWTKSAVACAQAIGSIIELTEEPDKSFYAKELMETVCRENFGSESLDEETTRVVMAVYKQCLGAKEVTGLDVMGWLNNEGCVFKSLWEGAGS